jgi:single-strand DNA-binding protein
MADLNTVILQGRITHDPELKTTQSGKNVSTASIAVNSYAGGTKVASFFNIVCWDKTANTLATYFKKGSQILLRGRLTNRSYEKDGVKRSVTEVVADEICFCGTKADNGVNAAASAYGASSGASTADMPKFEPVGSDEDLPF